MMDVLIIIDIFTDFLVTELFSIVLAVNYLVIVKTKLKIGWYTYSTPSYSIRIVEPEHSDMV
jgi:hypothetical protein